MQVIAFPTPSLGDMTYLAASEGQGLLVDPQRDVDRFLEAADSQNVTITRVLETHVHNDYVSGGREAARRTGADLVIPAGAGVSYRHVPAFHHEELDTDDGLVIHPIHTPGHTPEHVSYLVGQDGQPGAVFSGGSLLVGSAGRTDLLGDHLAEQLARLQFGSLQRLVVLPDDVGLYPTHGAGSFCTVSAAGASSSTLGRERSGNPLLAAQDEDQFLELQMGSLVPFPAYYQYMAPINRAGPASMPSLDPPILLPDEFEKEMSSASVVDARPRTVYVSGHIPGSLGVELGQSFASWVGWLLPFDSPLLLVLEELRDASAAVTELARIGFDHVAGVMQGVRDWKASGRPVSKIDVLTLEEALETFKGGVQLLDVRSPEEWDSGHLVGSLHSYVPDLKSGLPPALESEVVVACTRGHRASIAAGLLERHGVRPKVLLDGGVPGMLAAAGRSWES